MNETTQTEIRREGDPAFPQANSGNDNPPDSSSVDKTNDAEQTPPSEGEQKPDAKQADGEEAKDRGFADDPRWKEREEHWKGRYNSQEERHLNERNEDRAAIASLREEIENLKGGGPQAKAPGIPDIPEWFNGDERQWAQFVEWNRGLVKQAEENVRKALTSESEQEQQKIDKATQWLEQELTAIEGDKELNPEGVKIDRPKLLQLCLDEKLVDTEGRWNYRAAFKMLHPRQVFEAKKALDEKKKVASATTSEKRAETAPPPFMTSEDFRKPGARPW